MRIALFSIDSAATNAALRSFLQRHRDEVVFVGLSPPFRAARGGLLRQSLRHIRRSGIAFANFLACNFLLPRMSGALRVHKTGRTPPPVGAFCRAAGIEVQPVFDVNAPHFVEALAHRRLDLIVSCFFDQIFKRDTLRAARLSAVNVHPSLLPWHRGPMPVIFSQLATPSALGVSVHAVDEGIDTGPLLAQESYRSPTGESILRSMTVLHGRGLELVSGLLPALAAGSARGEKQSGGSYESFPDRADLRRLRRAGTPLFTWSEAAEALRTPAEF